MTNNPIKLVIAAGVVAVMAGSMLANTVETKMPARSAAAGNSGGKPFQAEPIESGRTWYSRFFEGMSFSSKPARQPPAPPPAPVQAKAATGFGKVSLSADAGGQYHASVEIEGQVLPMLVDTGATLVALKYEDAAALGVVPAPGEFNSPVSTANGTIKAARITLREVRVDNIRVQNVAAMVLPERALARSLLGMSFLKKLSSFKVAGGRLVLEP